MNGFYNKKMLKLETALSLWKSIWKTLLTVAWLMKVKILSGCWKDRTPNKEMWKSCSDLKGSKQKPWNWNSHHMCCERGRFLPVWIFTCFHFQPPTWNLCLLAYAMLMAYRVVEGAPPRENEKLNNVVVVTSLPVSLTSVHHFPCIIKTKTENVLYGIWF